MSSDTPGATVATARATDAATAIAAAAVGAVGEAAVLIESDGGIRRITLNRPAAANALRPQDRDAVIAALTDADADPTVRVVVLAANGRHFCSGADVKALAGDRASGGEKHVGDAMRKIMGGAQRLVSAVLDCGKPVLAVVGGPAAGIGAHLAFASDLVVASEDATFIESFVKRGLVVDGGGAYLLPRRVGLQKAKELAFFGDALTARDALALGLVNRVVASDQLAATAAELAGRLATAPTSAIALTKRLFNTSLDADRASAFQAEAMAQELQSHAHDSVEGVRSFVDHRPPQFRGH
jgi:2-(1,2-epoxy-1,2-dihydrophenyl)acetyl-CoA isomerase